MLVAPHQLDRLPPGRPPGIVVAPLSHDTGFLPRCAELVGRLEGERRDGEMIAVKYHPREAAGDPLAVAGRPGFVLLDQSVPLEAYLLRRGAAFVVGPPSTALLFARRVMPEIPVASLDLTSELGRVLGRAGVAALDPTGPTGLLPAPRSRRCAPRADDAAGAHRRPRSAPRTAHSSGGGPTVSRRCRGRSPARPTTRPGGCRGRRRAGGWEPSWWWWSSCSWCSSWSPACRHRSAAPSA